MLKFLYKFLLLFVLILGYLAWYSIRIYPNLSGEMGVLGQIPFGVEYDFVLDSVYHHKESRVFQLSIDDAPVSNIFTIGDSFSRQGIGGYQQFLGETIGMDINNIAYPPVSPEQYFLQLLHAGFFPTGSWVVVESVERSMINRLCELDFSSLELRNTYSNTNRDDDDMGRLCGAMAKLRIAIGYKNPIRHYSTNTNLFSHPVFRNDIFLYDSPWESYAYGIDGDFVFRFIKDESFSVAYSKLEQLNDLAIEKEIHFIYLIAADKYEVYEPFIVENHPLNPTLDTCPDEDWVINTKPLLQDCAKNGVKDIYRINDTHWSPIGAKIVGEEVAKRLQLN